MKNKLTLSGMLNHVSRRANHLSRESAEIYNEEACIKPKKKQQSSGSQQNFVNCLMIVVL